jgi:hypothetical protein
MKSYDEMIAARREKWAQEEMAMWDEVEVRTSG